MNSVIYVGIAMVGGVNMQSSEHRTFGFALPNDRTVCFVERSERCGEDEAHGEYASTADRALAEWARMHAINPGCVVPVSSDPSMIEKTRICALLPRFSPYLHPQIIDLAGGFHLLAETRTYLGASLDYVGWDKVARTVANYELLNRRGVPVDPASAADAASVALLTWRWVKNVLAMASSEVALFRGDGADAPLGFAMVPS
ncbi:hypothetical protein P3W23_09200 [Luteibacter sp. PPL554]